MQDGHLRTEAAAEAAHQLRGEGNLRHQHQGALAAGQRVFGGPQVHLRLAASRHALEQKGSEGGGVQRFRDGLDGGRLPLRQARRASLAEARPDEGHHLQRLHLDQAPGHQATDGLAGPWHGAHQLIQLRAPADGEEVAQRGRLGRGPGQGGLGSGRCGDDAFDPSRSDGPVLDGLGEAGRQRSPEGLPQRVAVVGRGEGEEAEDIRRQRRLRLQHLGNGLQYGAGGRLGRPEIEAEGAAPAEGHQQPLPGKQRPGVPRRQQVGEGAGDGPSDGDRSTRRSVHHNPLRGLPPPPDSGPTGTEGARPRRHA